MTKFRAACGWICFLVGILWCSACGSFRSASLGFGSRIEPVSCRLAENGEFVNVQFRFHGKEPFHPDRRETYLVDETTGEKFFLLALQRIGKVDRVPEPGDQPVHNLVFKNRDGLLKAGARVTLVVGELRSKHLLLEQ